MSSKIKNNFDYDKKRPQAKKFSSREDPHKAIKSGSRQDPQVIKKKAQDNVEDEINEQSNEPLLMTEIKVPKKQEKSDNNATKEEPKPEEKYYSERENYLKEKFEEMKVPEGIKKGIAETIDKTNLSIHDDIHKDAISIASKQKSLTEILSQKEKSIHIDDYEKFPPETVKRLLYLKNDEQNFKNTIAKLNQNLKVIQNQSYKGIQGGIIETNIRNKQINSIKLRKENLLGKLEEIEKEIDKILKGNEKQNKQNTIKEFLNNFEKDKEEIEKKMAEFKEKNRKIKQKMMEDLKISQEKKKKEIEMKEKEMEEKKKKEVQERRKREVDLIQNRKKEIDQKLEKTKKFIHQKNEKKLSDYLFYQKEKKFENEEKKLLEKVKQNKKEALVTKEEIDELNEKLDEQLEKVEKNAEEKMNELKELWKNRSEILPTYKGPAAQTLEEEEEENRMKEEEKKQQRLEAAEKRKEYEKSKVPKPRVDPKLKRLRESRIVRLEKNSIKALRLKNKKRILEKKKYQKKVHKKKLKPLEEQVINNTYVNKSQLNPISRKPKRLVLPGFKVHPKPEKKIDYLTEIRKKRGTSPNKKIASLVSQTLHSKKKSGNILESIQFAQAQTEALDTQIQQKKELIKNNGGYAKNPELGGEVGDMLVDLINAKLNILNSIKDNK